MNNYRLDLSVSEKFHSYNNVIFVDKQSNIDLYEEVYKIAKYFKEELNYDSVPFCPYGGLREEYKALLFTEEAYDEFVTEPIPYRIYGACLFSLMKFKEDDDYWELLEEEFGNFIIKTPISNDMRAFLDNIKSKNKHIEI